VCEMQEDDSVSLVLCYVGGTELHPMNTKAEEKRFSVVVAHFSTKSKEGECMCILAAVYSHISNHAVGSENLGRDLVREIGMIKESPRFFDVISVGTSLCALLIFLLSVWKGKCYIYVS
jgi:hypothetical protein